MTKLHNAEWFDRMNALILSSQPQRKHADGTHVRELDRYQTQVTEPPLYNQKLVRLFADVCLPDVALFAEFSAEETR